MRRDTIDALAITIIKIGEWAWWAGLIWVAAVALRWALA